MLKSLGLSLPVLVMAGGMALAAQQNSLKNPDQWLVSDVYKAAVYDTSHNNIGEINNLVLNSTGQIKTAVIGVGGFLSVGQKDVAVPFTDLKVTNYKGTEELTLDRTKQQLKDMPAWQKPANQ